MNQDKIVIKNLRVWGIIGILPHERITKQEILVNATMFTDITPSGESDDLSLSVNYAAVTERVTERIENGADLLIEKLVLDLANLILTEFVLVDRVIVRVEKPEALDSTETVGIEIDRSR